MDYSPTLSAEDFKKLHNAKCKLVQFAKKIEGVLKDELYSDLVQAIAEIENSLEEAYAAEEVIANRRDDRYTEVGKEIGAMSIWNIEHIEDMNQPHDWPTAKRLIYVKHFGDKPVTVEILGKTWRELYRAADVAIRVSKDTHHLFIEGFSVTYTPTAMREAGATGLTLELFTGS